MTTTSIAATADAPGDGAVGAGTGHYHMVWRRFRMRTMAVVSAGVLATLIVVCFVLPNYLAPLRTEGSNPFAPPSFAHPFGTDEIGQDLFTRVLLGGQVSLEVGLLAMMASVGIATFVGAVSGFLGGIVDSVLSAVTNAFLMVPGVLVLIAFAHAVARYQGTSVGVGTVVIGIALVSWPYTARIVRSVILSLREKEFVEAARALGSSRTRILVRHLLPNALGPILVAASLTVVTAILIESAISFLGVGIGEPIPTWGGLLNKGQQYVRSDFLYAFWPGLMIFATVLSFNFIGDALRDAFDVRTPDHSP